MAVQIVGYDTAEGGLLLSGADSTAKVVAEDNADNDANNNGNNNGNAERPSIAFARVIAFIR